MGSGHDFSQLFIELGLIAIFLAALARLASRYGIPSISLYLLAGLAFGNGGLAPLELSKSFIQLGAEIGVCLLLFMLGLEYSGDQLRRGLRSGAKDAVIDFVLNFPPGLCAGILLGWAPLPSVLLGGITLVSSSGIIARELSELGRTAAPEAGPVLSILVLEDLVMAVYLPLVALLLVGGGPKRIAVSVSLEVVAILVILLVATRYGQLFSSLIAHRSDEVILLTIFGIVLAVAGVAQHLHVSAAVGAFLVGIAISGPVAEHSYRLLSPIRYLFAATFFFFFGLDIDPRTLIPALPIAVGLGVVTILSKTLTGYLATRRLGLARKDRVRAGLMLTAHGEFSMVVAGLGAAIEPRLGPLAAAYVLMMAVLGPVLARLIK